MAAAATIPSPTTLPSSPPFSDQTTLSTPFSVLRNPSHIKLQSLHPPSHSFKCQSHGASVSSLSDEGGGGGGWDSVLVRIVRSAAEKFEGIVKSGIDGLKGAAREVKSEGNGTGEGQVEEKDWDWDWERWLKHFDEVVEQERLIGALKTQLARAVDEEDYAAAAKLKVAIAAVATKDTVGCAMSHLNRAIDRERYRDAVFMRDNAGVGLVGWWAGISDDSTDPYGHIIRIKAEHGRYIARSYSARQLAASTSGSPVFEIFLTLNKKGEYKHQAVYLKRKVPSGKSSLASPRPSDGSSRRNRLSPSSGKSDLDYSSSEDVSDFEDRDDLDSVYERSGFVNIIQDMIPDDPQKVDKDSESKMMEVIIDDDYDESESEVDDADMESRRINGQEFEVGTDSGGALIGKEDASEIAVEVVIGVPIQKAVAAHSKKDLLRVPAMLEKSGHKSFCFTVDNANKQSSSKDQTSTKRNADRQRVPRRPELVIFDLVKIIRRGDKMPRKLLRDLRDLISSISQAQDRPLLGSTTFNRIEFPAFPDPLNGLYIGSYGPFTSEVIQLRCKYGQWQEDQGSKLPSNLEFYEYVEAVKLTGDPHLPAGQVAFRAKIGKRYQLPHKGIIPEEFGVIARYEGQGRLADPEIGSPRWVNGELVVLDGKNLKAGPALGFVYWDPRYQYLEFFNRLRLEE